MSNRLVKALQRLQARYSEDSDPRHGIENPETRIKCELVNELLDELENIPESEAAPSANMPGNRSQR